MTLLPIVERELRVAARRRGTYWTRAAIVLMATLVGIATYLASLIVPLAKFGHLMFWGLSGMSMIYCLVAGRQMTADCLSEEKRDGTFGLLFLTDLKGYDVVLGKLAARSFNGFYGLLATVPVLAIPLLVAGMTYGEFWRMVVVLVDTFLFTLSIGIFASATSREYQHAMGRNFAVLLLTTALPPACAGSLLILQSGTPATLVAALLAPCPIYAFFLCADAAYTGNPILFWSSVAVIHCMTWVLIGLACKLAPRSWQDKWVPPLPETEVKKKRWQWWREGSAAKKNAFRKHLLDENAYYWLSGRPHVKPAWVWTLLVLVAGWILRTAVAVGQLEATVCITGALLLNSTLKLWIALEAGQQLAADQKSGAFELLLSTPLTVGEILRGQLLALARQFLKPLLVVIATEIILMVLMVQPAHRQGLDVTGTHVVWFWSAGIVMLAADAAALSVFGMASALIAKGYTQATMRTVRYILALPWALFGLTYVIVELCFELWPWMQVSRLGGYLSWKYELAMWFGFGILVDLLFGWLAWHQLRMDFRELALRSHGPVRSRFIEACRRRIRSATEAICAPRGDLKRTFILCTIAVVGVCLFLIHRFSGSRFPPPLVVSLGPTNTALRLFTAQECLLFILPDGSLWRWGKMDGTSEPRTAIPRRVGTYNDWVGAASALHYTIGLRGNGTIWSLSEAVPRQIGTGHDWVKISAGYDFSVALKRDGTLWGWGVNSMGQLGYATGPTRTDPARIGPDFDWKDIACEGNGAFALRQNGTIWIWGDIPTMSGQSSRAGLYSLPLQACSETNWSSIHDGYPGMARRQSGELYMLSYLATPPLPVSSAASVFHRLASVSRSAEPALCYFSGPTAECYEVRSNRTLWATPYSAWPSTMPVAQKWEKFGKREDWVAVLGNYRSIVALTADGTLWTWGTDWSRNPTARFRSRLSVLRMRLAATFGMSSAGGSPFSEYDIRKTPRPLMRLIPSAPSGTNRAAR